MSARTLAITPELHEYLLKTTLREPEVLQRLRRETAALPNARMQISPEQGQFMRLLIELLGARRALEVGVFTGYSALCVALALPESGRLLACDINTEWTAVAQRYWKEAGVAEKIELRLEPGERALDHLLAAGAAGSFDFMFIDADKTSYDAYYERGLRLLRAGGVIAIDNALWGGRVADAATDDADTRALQALNRKLGADERVTASLVPIGDGLWLARKR